MKFRVTPISATAALIISAAALCAPAANAASVTIGTLSFLTLDDAVSALGVDTYKLINSGYTAYSAATFSFTLGGKSVSMLYSATGTGGPEITLVDPGAGGSVLATFDGITRAAAEVGLMAFLTDYFGTKKETFELIVANTPDDPVAGNPTSLQTSMSNATFSSGTDIGPSPLSGGSRARGTLPYNHLGVSLESGRYYGPGYSANITTLPLSYAIPFDDPRWALKLDAPLTFATVNGEDIFSGSVGVGLRVPVYDNWTITPELRVGMTRNKTLGINATLVSASISSNFRHEFRNGFGLVIGNSLTYSKSVSNSGVNYGVDNIINKNGVEFSGPMEAQLFGLPTNWQFSVVHSKIYGNPTYIDEWVDVSASLGTIGSKNGVTWDSMRVGLTYTRANRGVQGINLNFGYEF